MALNQKLFVDLLLNKFYINLLHDMITKGGKHFKVLVYTNIQLLQLRVNEQPSESFLKFNVE